MQVASGLTREFIRNQGTMLAMSVDVRSTGSHDDQVDIDADQQKEELNRPAERVVGLDELDPYWKLRPKSATPDEELCDCVDRPPIVLQCHFSSNPIVCLRCNGEVRPERIGFSAGLAERIAFWKNVHDALYTLWLDSSDYESWAIAQLEDPNGQVNVEGLEVVRDLNKHRRTYYWWFQQIPLDDFVPLVQCPRCSANLVERFDRHVCEACSIAIPTG